MKNLLLLFLFVFTTLQATGAWMMSGRTHPELKWRTLKTEHFDVHYLKKIISDHLPNLEVIFFKIIFSASLPPIVVFSLGRYIRSGGNLSVIN